MKCNLPKRKEGKKVGGGGCGGGFSVKQGAILKGERLIIRAQSTTNIYRI